jgi:hypothetical protein
MNDSFRKYAAYAFGELLLVILGILVALQIDNWNEDRKERATLQSYLESIARNMQEDLTELEPLRAHRLESIFAAARFDALRNRDSFDVDEIFFLNQLWALSAAQSFFSANTSGFEALKSSGVLDRLQGSGIEQLLSRYYDTVNQIALLENGLYDTTRPIITELRREQPRELEAHAVMFPTALSPARFQEVQPLYSQLVNSPITAALMDAQFANQILMLHYDSLQALGQAYTQAVEAGSMEATEAGVRTPFDNFNKGLGLADIVSRGRPAFETYWLSSFGQPGGTLIFRFDSLQMRGEELHIDYPGGSDWAAVIWMAVNVAARRSHMDFSRFTKLHLELKGDQGGEKLLVHVKDADYPDDQSPISVELTLDSDWQSYEIDLAEFKPNDLSRLHVVLGILIYPAEHPLAFSVRNARYE